MQRRAILSLMLVLAFGACSDSGTGPEASITGRYELQTFNGEAVPADVFFQGVLVTIERGHLNLNADESFTADLTVSASDEGQTGTLDQSFFGTYMRNGNALFLTYSDGSQINGTIEDGRVSWTSGIGWVLVFEK